VPANEENVVAYDTDIADKLNALETLANRRTHGEEPRCNVDFEEFDTVSTDGSTVGILMLREPVGPNPPLHVYHTVTRR
jgi:hypothetical protein